MRKKLRGSTATYRDSRRKNDVCDLEELAETYSNMGKIPERIGWRRAAEIQMLSIYFLTLWRLDKKRQRGQKKETTSPERQER